MYEHILEGMLSLDIPSLAERHGSPEQHTRNVVEWGKQKLTNLYKAKASRALCLFPTG
jgi:hypothetical protein